MVVAIDGPAGTGKSSVSRCVADATGFLYLNSGRFYRAIAWVAARAAVEPSQSDKLAEIARTAQIELEGEQLAVDGHLLARELHSAEVDATVAEVSAVPEVREAVNVRLKRIAHDRDVIVEGRDMATVVFPDARVKIFLDAQVKERARRRHAESADGQTLEQIERAIERRDNIDRTKTIGALRRADDAHLVDTTDLTLDDVCEKVIAIIRKHTSDGRSI